MRRKRRIAGVINRQTIRPRPFYVFRDIHLRRPAVGRRSEFFAYGEKRRRILR